MKLIISFLEKLLDKSKIRKNNKRAKGKNRVSYMKHYETDNYGNEVNIPLRLKKIWLKEEKEYIEKTNSEIYMICGTFSPEDVEFVSAALSEGYTVNAICGNTLYNGKVREQLVQLKEIFGDKFKLSIY